MISKAGILILGDQLSWRHPVLAATDPSEVVVILAEVAEEATYVKHNRHKIALIFSAMRHFAQALEARGFTVQYYRLKDGLPTLLAACERACEVWSLSALHICEPGEFRLSEQMVGWDQSLGIPVTVHDDTRFLSSRADFAHWAKGRKQLRMEYFYREMRKRYRLLMEGDQPEGGKWN